MKTLHLSIIVAVGFTLLASSILFLVLSIQNQPHSKMLVQMDMISKNSSSIHACVSKQEKIFDPGQPGFASLMCPITPNTYSKVVDYSGFDDVCHDKKYNATNYFLNPGHNGSITYKIYLDVPFSDVFRLLYVNMTNHATFEHYYATPGGSGWKYTETDDGTSVSFVPKSEMLWPWSPVLVTAKILALPDAKEGSHWLIFSPGPCGGGPGFILTVNNASKLN